MQGKRKLVETTLLLAALLASLFSVGTAWAQSNDSHGRANSSQRGGSGSGLGSGAGDSVVFDPAAHAPSPPSDFLKGHIGENGSAVSVHELSIPGKAREAYNKGIRQADAGDWARSIPNFQRAIKSFPTFYEAYCGLGVAEVYLQSWNEAEAAFRKCIELSGGTFAVAHFGLGVILSHRKQFPEAEATIREGIELDPADARGHFSLAWVLHTMGRLPEAERSAREAILYKPTFPNPYLLLAQIHLLQGNSSAEIEDLDGYLKVDPNGPLSARARAALADAKRSLTKGNTSAPTKP
jgi:tetratricopeptide (TPR) repeat protein